MDVNEALAKIRANPDMTDAELLGILEDLYSEGYREGGYGEAVFRAGE